MKLANVFSERILWHEVVEYLIYKIGTCRFFGSNFIDAVYCIVCSVVMKKLSDQLCVTRYFENSDFIPKIYFVYFVVN